MTDRVGRATRSRIMAGMPSKWTRPEQRVAELLAVRGAVYVPHRRVKVGATTIEVDFYCHEMRLAIFVDGCFVHGHWHSARLQAGAYWKKKVAETIARDVRNNRLLARCGYRVARLWSCQIDAGRIAAILSGAKR